MIHSLSHQKFCVGLQKLGLQTTKNIQQIDDEGNVCKSMLINP